MSEDNIALPSDVQYLFKQPDGFKYELATNRSAPCTLSGIDASDCKQWCDPNSGSCYNFYYPDESTTQYLYETYPDQISPIDGVTDEHFIVWMRTATLPTFRKLYGKIHANFNSGDVLTLGVTANYEVSSFGGSKKLVITTVGEFGGQNSFPGLAFITTGAFAFVLAAFYGVKDFKMD
jgi:hypothetical protein